MLRTMGHGCVWLFLLTLTLQVLPVQRPVHAVQRPSSALPKPDTWQSSEAPSVRLGVRNKLGTRDKYTAIWIVSGADGSRYEARATVKGDDWGDVYFPDDFPAISKPIRYTWTLSVDGQRMFVGSFEFKSVRGYSDQLEAPIPRPRP